MRRYNNDPRRIQVKYACNCHKCNAKLLKGVNAYYFPAERHVFCLSCGETPYRQFLSSAADEEVYNGTGNPFYS